MALALAWLTECESAHTDCQQPSIHPLPARVIAVGDGAKCHLVTPARIPGRYFCLSHRWGKIDASHPQLITTKQTLPEHMRGISLTALPQTFREAVIFTRYMGIQYLWIDSLCILQDDIEDWRRESAQMGEYYSNAYATIFAERADNCHGGLFRTAADEELLRHHVDEVEYRNEQTGVQSSVVFCKSEEESFCSVSKSMSHLRDRGWIMQEELLSHRKVCFSGTELHWKCKTLSQCQCGFKDNPDKNQPYDAQPQHAPSLPVNLTEMHSDDFKQLWKLLIEAYSPRLLTKEQDRLNALAGIAGRFRRPIHDYMAGMWREHLDEQLLWYPLAGHRPCHRHSSFSPSWSWTSVSGSIKFEILENEWKKLWNIENGACSAAEQNPFGEVSAGWMVVTGPAASVTVLQKIAPSVRSVSSTAWDNGCYEIRDDHNGAHILVMQAMSSEGTIVQKPSETILRLDAPEDWNDIAEESQTRKYLYLIAGVGRPRLLGSSDTAGLLLRQSVRQQNSWERVCFVRASGRWRDWEQISIPKTLRLI